MKLLTKSLADKIPPVGSQEGKGDDAIAYVRFFLPVGHWTWYATEFDPESGVFVGLVFGDSVEYGLFSLDQLQRIRVMGLGVERDLNWKPQSVAECRKHEGRLA